MAGAPVAPCAPQTNEQVDVRRVLLAVTTASCSCNSVSAPSCCTLANTHHGRMSVRWWCFRNKDLPVLLCVRPIEAWWLAGVEETGVSPHSTLQSTC